MNMWKKGEFDHLFVHWPVPDETMDSSKIWIDPPMSEEAARQLKADAAYVASLKKKLLGR